MKGVKYRLVFNRKGKELGKDEEALIQIEVYQDRKRRYFSTNVYVKEHQFKKGVIVNHPNARILNFNLQEKIHELQKYEYESTNEHKEFSIDKIEEYKKASSSTSFIDFINSELDNNKTLRPGTVRNHNVLLHLLDRFGKIKRFEDLTYSNIKDWDNWLREKDDDGNIRSDTSVYGYHKRMKRYINKAIADDKFPPEKNPYLRFSCKAGRYADRKFLSQEELNKIETKQISHKRLSIIKDVFLFQCYTGLSYSDIEKLTYKLISVDEDGFYWYKGSRQKTDEETIVMLLPKAVELLKKYEGKEKCFPVIANSNYNVYLKELADICNVDKELTTHMARHTFATTIMLANGVSLETVSKTLGHASIKTTQIYAKIVDKRIKNEMVELTKRLEK